MVFIHVPHHTDGKKADPHETAKALFFVAFFVLAFAVVVVTVGPKTGSPPPPAVRWGIIGLFIGTALLAIITWLKWQGEGNAASQDSDSHEEK